MGMLTWTLKASLGVDAKAAADVRLCPHLAEAQERTVGTLVERCCWHRHRICTPIAADGLGCGRCRRGIDAFLGCRLSQLGFDEFRFRFNFRCLPPKSIAITSSRFRLLLQVCGVYLHKGYAGGLSNTSSHSDSHTYSRVAFVCGGCGCCCCRCYWYWDREQRLVIVK